MISITLCLLQRAWLNVLDVAKQVIWCEPVQIAETLPEIIIALIKIRRRPKKASPPVMRNPGMEREMGRTGFRRQERKQRHPITQRHLRLVPLSRSAVSPLNHWRKRKLRLA